MAVEELIIDVSETGADKTEKALDGVADATNKADDSAKAYQSTLGDVAKEAKFMGVSVNSLKSGLSGTIGTIKASVTSLKAFKIALIATGVGAFVVIIGSLVAAFAQTQKGMDAVEDVTTTLAAAWRELGNLANELFNIVGDLFSGTISVGEAFDKAGDSVGKFKEDVAEAVTETKNQNAAQRELDAELRRYVVTLAEQNLQLEENRRLGEDITTDLDARIEATGKVRDAIAEQGEIAVGFLVRQLELERERLDGLILTDEEETRLFDLEAQIFDARAEAVARDITEQAKYNALLKEQNTLNQIQVLDLQPKEIAQTDQQIAITKALGKVEIATLKTTTAGKKKASDFQTASTFAEVDALGVKAIMQAVAGAPPPFNLVLVALATALIAGIRSKLTSLISPVIPSFGEGGIISGASHANGGVLINAEGNEGIINKKSMSNPHLRALASAINVAGGGIPFMQAGGVVPTMSGSVVETVQVPILVLEDLDITRARVAVTESITTL